MNAKQCCTITSILTTGLLATAAPNWHDKYRPTQDMLTPPKEARILPPTHPDDLTPGIYKSARSYCWEARDFGKARAISVFRSNQLPLLQPSKDDSDLTIIDDSDLTIINARGVWQDPNTNCFTTPSQLAYIFSKNPKTYGTCAILLYANATNCGGGNFWYGGLETCAAQEETEIKNLLGIYRRISSVRDLTEQEGLLVKYKTPLYDQKGGPFTVIVVPDHPMGSFTGTDASGILAHHGQNLRNYVKLPDPILVDVIFLAAPDLGIDKKTGENKHGSILAEDYMNCIMNMFRVYMVALARSGAQTALSGPLGCGVFANPIPAVALCNAWALRYYRPGTLKKFVICGSDPFYRALQDYYGKLSTIFPDKVPTARELLEQFPEVLKGVPDCITQAPASSDKPVVSTQPHAFGFSQPFAPAPFQAPASSESVDPRRLNKKIIQGGVKEATYLYMQEFYKWVDSLPSWPPEGDLTKIVQKIDSTFGWGFHASDDNTNESYSFYNFDESSTPYPQGLTILHFCAYKLQYLIALELVRNYYFSINVLDAHGRTFLDILAYNIYNYPPCTPRAITEGLVKAIEFGARCADQFCCDRLNELLTQHGYARYCQKPLTPEQIERGLKGDENIEDESPAFPDTSIGGPRYDRYGLRIDSKGQEPSSSENFDPPPFPGEEPEHLSSGNFSVSIGQTIPDGVVLVGIDRDRAWFSTSERPNSRVSSYRSHGKLAMPDIYLVTIGQRVPQNAEFYEISPEESGIYVKCTSSWFTQTLPSYDQPGWGVLGPSPDGTRSDFRPYRKSTCASYPPSRPSDPATRLCSTEYPHSSASCRISEEKTGPFYPCDPVILCLYDKAKRHGVMAGSDMEIARRIVVDILGAPNTAFVDRCSNPYGYGTMQGTAILHSFAWAHEPFILLALTEWGFDINYINVSGLTPLDVYVQCCDFLPRSHGAFHDTKSGLYALVHAGAYCEVEGKKLRDLLEHYGIKSRNPSTDFESPEPEYQASYNPRGSNVRTDRFPRYRGESTSPHRGYPSDTGSMTRTDYDYSERRYQDERPRYYMERTASDRSSYERRDENRSPLSSTVQPTFTNNPPENLGSEFWEKPTSPNSREDSEADVKNSDAAREEQRLMEKLLSPDPTTLTQDPYTHEDDEF